MNVCMMSSGREKLALIEGTSEPSIVEALKDIAPDLAGFAISFVYGEIYTREGLSVEDRQIVTVAALAAMGGLESQLKFHIAGALNVGYTPSQLVELMTHLVVYAGFPAALNGVSAVREVFRNKGIVAVPTSLAEPPESRFKAGLSALNEIDGAVGTRVIDSLSDISPDLGRFIVEFAFGEIYTRPGLNLFLRELATVAALAAMGSAMPQLKVHMHGFLNVGGSREQLVETIIQVAAYAGFPRAINAALVARDVLADRDAGRHH
ncbi:carboxymuconolactone decarboxylase family protein [uncultured Caballeronia sp.]|uniref:carboxymuconolactone decarboxylase family protein n=1 Tax=uncultured Caballeronia sp. TaxID=1827198 RepID=UPI00157545C7